LFKQAFSVRHVLFGTSFLQKGYLKKDKEIEERLQAVIKHTKDFVLKRF
jgi:hypothetical protein